MGLRNIATWRNGKTVRVVGLGLLGLLLAAAAGGCATINVPDYSGVAKEAVRDYSGNGSESDWAVQRSREAAIQSGLTVDQLSKYTISPTKGDQCWWVDFRYLTSEKTHWPERFVVRVDMDGKTRTYHYTDVPKH